MVDEYQSRYYESVKDQVTALRNELRGYHEEQRVTNRDLEALIDKQADKINELKVQLAVIKTQIWFGSAIISTVVGAAIAWFISKFSH